MPTMRLTIFTKLFLAILMTMLVMVIVMALFVNMSFRNGFADYINRGHIDKVKELTVVLSDEYEKHGSWDFIRQSPREWRRLISKVPDLTLRRRPPPRRPPPSHDFGGRRPPPPDGSNYRPPPPRNNPTGPVPLGERISLIDADKQAVVGRVGKLGSTSSLTNVKIKYDDSTIGWVVVRQGKGVFGGIAEKFLDQQLRNSYSVAALAMLIAILSAALLARHFVGPVKALSKGAKSLSSGNLETRIRVTSNDELGELASDFNKLAQTLGKNEIQRKQWLVDISHELRTPIAVLRSEIEAMMDGIRDPTNKRIRSLHTDIMSLGKLVEDLYQLSLSDSTEIIIDEAPIDIVDVVSDAMKSADSLLKQKHIELKVSNIDDVIMVAGNKRSLHQLFSNLLANSYRYTDENGSIEIAVENKKDTVEVIIQDSTPGVPEESLTLLFDRLYRVDKSRNRALGGSGLGLSICAKIVNEHEGTIEAAHSPLGGLLIKIQFSHWVSKEK